MSKSSAKDKTPKEKGNKKRKKAARKAEKAARKALAPMALPAPERASPLPGPPVLGDMLAGSSALDQARARWEHGDWAAILTLDTPALENDPERAKLALLLSAAHSHAGAPDRARHLARQALVWGASRTMAARVLLSAAQNSLARAAAALEEDATPQFEAAIRLVQPHADVPLLARSRRLRELATLGLLPQAAEALEQELGLVRAEGVVPSVAQLADLQVRMGELRSLLDGVIPAPRRKKRRKPTVVIAGVPRSGSTWLYNATRLLLESAGRKVHARWHADYTPDRDDNAEMHLVKVHNPEQLTFPHDLILTTNRDIVDRLASLIRMGWLAENEEAVRKARQGHEQLYAFWKVRTDLEVAFDMIRKHPERAIQSVAAVLDIPCNPKIAAEVNRKINALKEPENGKAPDKVSQMHPGHRSDGTQTARIAEWIRTIL